MKMFFLTVNIVCIEADIVDGRVVFASLERIQRVNPKINVHMLLFLDGSTTAGCMHNERQCYDEAPRVITEFCTLAQ